MYSLSNKVNNFRGKCINHTATTNLEIKVHQEQRNFAVEHVINNMMEDTATILKVEGLIHHISDICAKAQVDSTQSGHGQKVCMCVCFCLSPR